MAVGIGTMPVFKGYAILIGFEHQIERFLDSVYVRTLETALKQRQNE